ncbi:hypothetical protein LJK88_02545 [Paenibacillus sp. P26]|nr:hypothetical protein LJK88_02545 [Paenibacillus sp. P26]
MGQTEWDLISLPLESQEEDIYQDTKENTKKRMHIDWGTRSPNANNGDK